MQQAEDTVLLLQRGDMAQPLRLAVTVLHRLQEDTARPLQREDTEPPLAAMNLLRLRAGMEHLRPADTVNKTKAY